MRFSTSSVLCVVALSASAANAAIVNAAPVSIEAREARGGRNTAKLDAAGNILNGVSGIIDVGKSIWERLTTRDLEWLDEPITQFAARDTDIWAREVDEDSSFLETREARGGRNTAKVDAAGNILNGVSGIIDVGKSIWDRLTSRDIVVDQNSLLKALQSRDIVVDKESLANALASRDVSALEEDFLARLEGRDVSTVDEDFLARLEGREARNGANTAKVDAAGNLLNGVSGIIDTAKSFWERLTSRDLSEFEARDILDDDFSEGLIARTLLSRAVLDDDLVDSLISARNVADDEFVASLSAREVSE